MGASELILLSVFGIHADSVWVIVRICLVVELRLMLFFSLLIE